MSHPETPADDAAGSNDIFNPFSAPQPSPESSEPSRSAAEAESAQEPRAAVQDDAVNVLFQAPDLATVKPRTPAKTRSADTEDSDSQDEDQPESGSRRRGSRRSGSNAGSPSKDDSASRRGDRSASDGDPSSGAQDRPGQDRSAQGGDSANSDSQGRDSQNSSSQDGDSEDDESQDWDAQSEDDQDGDGQGRRSRRKRRRGGRNKNRSSEDSSDSDSSDSQSSAGDSADQRDSARQNGSKNSESKNGDSKDGESGDGSGSQSRSERETSSADDDEPVIRKRRRRRRGSADLEVESNEDDAHTVTRVRAPREAAEAPVSDKVTGLKGSTRLEAKRQRRRSSRDTGRRRQVITEAEFLARRESVDRKMIVRQRGERIQIGVLEDGVLAEHYVSHTTQDSLIGNVYLGKVQNVLPSMEAAFVDIGRGRNAVLYAGEVDWAASRLSGGPRKIENALKSGDSVLVQVTKDPVGHKGARLTSQISLPGRYLVFVPGGSMTGISRKLPDTERARLKKVLKDHMPDNAGVIVRTAAEGASEEELTNDINRLRSLWEQIQRQSDDKKVLAPELFYAEPDLTIKVVRDVFNEDFSSMEVQGDETWDNIEAYVTYVAPHLLDRLQQWIPEEQQADDIFSHHRIDEQLNKALDRKVNLPSGGSLVFDRTEAMTVVDVNTGKFVGSGGNLEETVTKNNLEAAEELVRQLRLRDIGGIIVVDFIDMVLEVNRDLVLRRLVECLGRDRTKHQVAEVTSLGLIQMTRKRMGTGLLEVFSEDCEHCAGRGVITHAEPIEHGGSFTSHGDPQKARAPKKRRKAKGRRPEDDNDSQQSTPEVSAEEKERQEKARQALAQVAAATASKHAEEEQRSTGDRDKNTDAGAEQGSAKNAETGADRNDGDRSAENAQSGSTSGSRPARRRGRRSASQPAGSAGSSTPADSGAADSGAAKTDSVKTGTAKSDAAAAAPAEASGEKVLKIGGEEVPLPRAEKREQKAPASAGASSQDKQASLDTLGQALDSREPRSPAPARRRRRAAGSVQGASGEVQQIAAAQKPEGKTFSSAQAEQGSAETATKKPATEPVMLGVGVKAEEISRPE
ncbi:Rne/Rng family ribonuclease [Nesterenkonia sp. LB17]|uniref:Rne/Rng family ribonuclease n=1 Tax=Nesterenkonia sp. LB17 TaxID=2901230 RepID=UPI001F4C56C0|nr:Rne/Rng family ribonuclease [Nesterenkonia sp. LB17]MCH8565172.1 Rne/Rng family ribonuclease [Nesterenkonia sp. LB17]